MVIDLRKHDGVALVLLVDLKTKEKHEATNDDIKKIFPDDSSEKVLSMNKESSTLCLPKKAA